MKILIAGDFCQSYRVDRAIREHNYSTLFDNVASLIKQSDYSIVNFEFPVVLNKKSASPILKCGPNLYGTREAIDAIQYAGFNVCTLANNHILDQGEVCCIDTINTLHEANIETVGAGRNLSEACDILYLQKDNETLAVINCCENEFSIASAATAGANPLNPIQQFYQIREARKAADYVLVIVHGGHELHQLPSPRMKETYRFFIDAGADAVVNHHQHCYSGCEMYNGKPIYYGLGNFLFDSASIRDDIWNEGFMVELSFHGNEVQAKEWPYKQCNESASVVMLNEKELEDFQNHIKSLNQVISDDDCLLAATEMYYNSCKDYELSILRPYHNRISQKLFSLGFLPEVINISSQKAIENHIGCESHRDRLLYAIRHK